jgi:hypothetical protein
MSLESRGDTRRPNLGRLMHLVLRRRSAPDLRNLVTRELRCALLESVKKLAKFHLF